MKKSCSFERKARSAPGSVCFRKDSDICPQRRAREALGPRKAPMKKLFGLLAVAAFPLLLLDCSKPEPPAPKPAEEAQPAVSAPAPSASESAAAAPAPTPTGPALKIAYSDWPGWIAWDIGIQKGWFKEAGVNVDFAWFEYAPSMDAYSAGKVDAVAVTNGDALVTGSSGAPSKCILINDYSNGNDMIVAKPGIKSVADLKGKKIGVEVGLVDHLLLLKALESAKLTEKDVKIKNVSTDQTPQALKSGTVDAIAAWQPNSGQALKELPGSTAVFTSANAPGLIFDHLCVNPKSLAERRADWDKVVKVWFQIADFIKDPKNVDEAAKIMGARVKLPGEEYKKLMAGTAFQDMAGNLKAFTKGDGLDSVYGSSKIVDAFFTKNKMYKKPVKYEEYFDPSLVEEVSKAGK
jgi:NitT/TauT family transport system substrate-binding protein